MDEPGLFAAILAAPDDDAPRLVYADWLDDHGDHARAEFIRAQVELALPPTPRSRTRRRALERRVGALWKEHGAEWEKRPGGTKYLEHWERGWCASARFDGIPALAAGLAGRRAEAPIRHVEVIPVERADLPALIGLSALAGLRSLSLWSYGPEVVRLTGPDIETLAACPRLAGLESLTLTGQDFGEQGVRALVGSPHLRSLRELRLRFGGLNDECVRVLAASPLARQLHALQLSHIGTDGARIIGRSRAFAGLHALILNHSVLHDAGVRALARSPHLAGLTVLSLEECHIGDAGVAALAASPHLAGLESLDLHGNWSIRHAGAVALAESPYLKHIRRIDLWRCEALTRADKALLRKRFRSRVNFDR